VYENSQDGEFDGQSGSSSIRRRATPPDATEESVENNQGSWGFREIDSWTPGSDSFDLDYNVVGKNFHQHQGQQGLVPRRLGSNNSLHLSDGYILSDNGALSNGVMGRGFQPFSVGRHSSPVKMMSPVSWLQDTSRKFRRTETWCPQSHMRNIDESKAQDMCSMIERGIISDSVTLPPELLSP
jgi:hypothetical protein